MDIAVLITKTDIPGRRNVWIHTAESIIFRQNLHRVIAAQAVLGKCTVPVYRKVKRAKKTIIQVDYVRIQFQVKCSVCWN